MIKQCTLKQSISAVGIGLHTGRKVKLVMHPAAPDTGIIFRRVDLTPTVELPVRAEAVNDTRLATTLNEAGHGDIDLAVHVLKEGASHERLQRPWNRQPLRRRGRA